MDELTSKIDTVATTTPVVTLPQRWLSIKTAAKYTEHSTNSIRHLLLTGKLTAHRLTRGKILVDKEELDNVIRTSTNQLRKGRGFHMK